MSKVSAESIINDFIDIARYASRCFNTENVNPIDIWSKLAYLTTK